MVTLLLTEPQCDRPALEAVGIDTGVVFPNAADGEYHDVGSRSRAEYAEVPAPGLVERDMRQVREHGARVAGAVVIQAVGVGHLAPLGHHGDEAGAVGGDAAAGASRKPGDRPDLRVVPVRLVAHGPGAVV